MRLDWLDFSDMVPATGIGRAMGRGCWEVEAEGPEELVGVIGEINILALCGPEGEVEMRREMRKCRLSKGMNRLTLGREADAKRLTNSSALCYHATMLPSRS